jgi:hypothetical protein
MYKGGVFNLEKGAKVSDLKSTFNTNSALFGGVAYITDDFT